MPSDAGDRTRYWPAIEKKHGRPMQYWFDLMKGQEGRTYQQQVDMLRGEHGFSQAHANALVMYTRGSASQRRFATLDDYIDALAPEPAATVRAIVRAIARGCPDGAWVIAWNQPMLKAEGGYAFGISVSTSHILLAPWGTGVLESFAPRLKADGLTVQKKTFRVPLDWQPDTALLDEMVRARMAQLAAGG